MSYQGINWEEQWSIHCPYFKDNLLQLPLSNKILKLYPGPGFGDLSHPTTRLTLSMMSPHVQGKNVVDIGCGSGILTLAALLLGANHAIGIDIEEEALQHAEKNAVLNGLEKQVQFVKPDQFSLSFSKDVVILMNMIRSEQRVAWNSLPALHSLPGICFTSGVLVTERDAYVHELMQRGWKLLNEQEEQGWLCFHWDTT